MKIEIYGTSWCKNCNLAITFCKNREIDYVFHNVEKYTNRIELEYRVESVTAMVPQVFVDNERVPNGYSGLVEKLGEV